MYYNCKEISRKRVVYNGMGENILYHNDMEISEYDFIAFMFDNFAHDNPNVRASYLPTAFENHMKSLSSEHLLEVFKKYISG